MLRRVRNLNNMRMITNCFDDLRAPLGHQDEKTPTHASGLGVPCR
jgi:hypothetical protein